MHRDFAENPGIRVAQVTAGTRCYTDKDLEDAFPQVCRRVDFLREVNGVGHVK